MDHASIVSRLDSLGHLTRNADRFIGRHSPSFQSLSEILAGNQFHRQEPCALVRVDTENGGDVRVVQRGEQFGLALETGKALGVGGERFRKKLDRYLAIEGGVHGLPDHAHPTFANLFDESVMQELLAGF